MAEITIYRQATDGSVEEIFVTPINEGDIYSRKLMSEDYILLKFSLTEPIYFQLGDYCDTDFGRFELVDFYRPSYNISTGGYDYELRLDAEYYKWENKIFKYRPQYEGQEASWTLTDKIDVFMTVFLANLSVHGYKYKRNADYTVVYEDGTDFSARKPITFSNTNLIDALTTIAEHWECEWWVVNQEIHFGKCQLGTEDDALEFEDGVSVDKMSSQASSDEYFSRLFVFGGTTNIPARYRKQLIFDNKQLPTENIGFTYLNDTARPLTLDMFSAPQFQESTQIQITGNGNLLRKDEFVTIAEKNVISIRGLHKFSSFGFKLRILYSDDKIGEMVWGKIDSRVTIWDKKDGKNLLTSEFKRGIYYEHLPDNPVAAGLFHNGIDLWVTGSEDVKETGIELFENSYYISVEAKISEFNHSSDYGNNVFIFTTGNQNLELKDDLYWITFGVRFLSGPLNNGNIYDARRINETQIFIESKRLDEFEYSDFALGTRYEIVNVPGKSQLLRPKVPASYFTQDYTTETTLTGIVEQHLMLPETWNDGKNYIDAKEDLTEEEKVEGVLVLDDINPETECKVTSVDHYQTERKDDNTGGGTGVWDTYYLVNDANINLEKDYILPNVNNFSIEFTSGKLSSMEFEINLLKAGDHLDGNVKLSDGTIGVYEAKGQMFHILANENYGRKLPDNLLYPELNDTFIIKGYDPDFFEDLGLVTKAEEKLLEKGKEAIKKSNIDPNTYTCPLYWWKAKEYGNLQLGQRVRLVSKAYFPLEDRLSRIIGFTIKLDIPHDNPEYMVGESAPYSRIGALESKLNEITVNGTTYIQAGEYGGSGSLYIIKTGSLAVPSDNNVYSAKRSDKQFLRKDTEDRAEEQITFAKGLKAEDLCTFTVGLISVLLAKFKNGADFGEYAEGASGAIIDGNGSAEFGNLSVRDLLTSNTAKIREIIDTITFDDIATFVQGLTTRDIYSDDWVSGLKGFAAYHKDSGKSYAEVDELLVRVKAVFNELEIRKLSYAGGNIELSGAGSTIYRVKSLIGPADGNLIPDSNLPTLDADYISANDSAELIPHDGYNELHIKETSASLPVYYGLFYNLAVEPGETYTISFHYHGDLVEGGVLELAAALEVGGADYYRFPFAPDGSNKMPLEDNDDDTYVMQTVHIPSTCKGLKVKIWLRRKGEIFISRPRVEKGDTATEWGAVKSYRCYLIRDDGTTATRNWWQVGDMAKCQTFNLAQKSHEVIDENGIYDAWEDVSNRYYWRAVTAVGEETLDDDKTYNYIDLANTAEVVLPTWVDGEEVPMTYQGMDNVFEDFETDGHPAANDAPMADDAIVQEGNLINEDRQHIIRLCVIGENAPSIEEYVGVKTYELAKYRKTMIAPRTGDVFVAKRFEIAAESGVSYRVPCDRGEYTKNMECYYYDRVSYNGSLWLCISKEGNVLTDQDGFRLVVAPSASATTIWQKQVDKGADGKDGKDAVNIVVTGRNGIFKKTGDNIKVYVEVYVGDERLAYSSGSNNEWVCGTLGDTDRILDGKIYWTFDTEDNRKRFYYQLYCVSTDFAPTEIPFTVTVRGVTYQRSLYLSNVKDGEDALTVTLSPEAVILTQSPTDGSIDLRPASTRVTVYKGMTDVTSDATISIAETDGCMAEQDENDASVIIVKSLIGQPETGSVVISVTYQGVTVQKTFSFAVNYLGKFKETIENDVKKQIASKEFSYVGEDGTIQTTSGISEIVQSADAISQRVGKVEDGLLTAQSEIKQNAESISLSVFTDSPDDVFFDDSHPSIQSGEELRMPISDFSATAPFSVSLNGGFYTLYDVTSGSVSISIEMNGGLKTHTQEVVTDNFYEVNINATYNDNEQPGNAYLIISNQTDGTIDLDDIKIQKRDNLVNGLTKTGIDISHGTIHLQADNTIIDNDVTVGSLITEKTEDGAYIKLSGGEMAVYGLNLKPTIQFGIDKETGNAVLKFYNSKGEFMYNLGPDSFPGLINNSVKDGWNPTEEEGGVLSLPFTNGAASSTVFRLLSGELLSPMDAAPYYMFCEGYTFEGNQKVFIHGGRYDGKWYNSTDVNTVHEPTGDTSYEPTGDTIADGTYSCELSGSDYLSPNSKTYPRSIGVTFRRFANGKCVKIHTVKLQITYYYEIIKSATAASSTTGPLPPVEPVPTRPKIDKIIPETITLPDSFYTNN